MDYIVYLAQVRDVFKIFDAHIFTIFIVRISPATAKFKAPSSVPAFDLPQVSFTPPVLNGPDIHGSAISAASPSQGPVQNKSVSAPIAAAGSNMSLNSNAASNAPTGSSIGGSLSSNSLSSGTGSSTSISTSAFANSPEDVASEVLARLAQQYAELDAYKTPSSASAYLQDAQLDPAARYMISEESWKHHAQARAILGNLIGPNGEQVTSTDPYNTTVFVGGLSPLISEETLRTFFAPFGDIHYVRCLFSAAFIQLLTALNFRSKFLLASTVDSCSLSARPMLKRR